MGNTIIVGGAKAFPVYQDKAIKKVYQGNTLIYEEDMISTFEFDIGNWSTLTLDHVVGGITMFKVNGVAMPIANRLPTSTTYTLDGAKFNKVEVKGSFKFMGGSPNRAKFSPSLDVRGMFKNVSAVIYFVGFPLFGDVSEMYYGKTLKEGIPQYWLDIIKNNSAQSSLIHKDCLTNVSGLTPEQLAQIPGHWRGL